MITYIQENGTLTCEKDKVNINIKMAIFLKENGETTNNIMVLQ